MILGARIGDRGHSINHLHYPDDAREREVEAVMVGVHLATDQYHPDAPPVTRRRVVDMLAVALRSHEILIATNGTDPLGLLLNGDVLDPLVILLIDTRRRRHGGRGPPQDLDRWLDVVKEMVRLRQDHYIHHHLGSINFPIGVLIIGIDLCQVPPDARPMTFGLDLLSVDRFEARHCPHPGVIHHLLH